MTVVALNRRPDEAARQLLRSRKTLGGDVKYLALRLAFESILPDQPAEPPSKDEFDVGLNLAIALLYDAAQRISTNRPVMAVEIS